MRIHFLALMSLPALILAQTSTVLSSSATSNGNAVSGSIGLSGRSFMGAPVVGAPFSAQRVTEHVQVAADGTRFTQTNRQETIYRDSQGRVRTERSMMMGLDGMGADSPMLIEIQDPVAGFSYTLDSQNKVAYRVALQTPEARRMVMASNGGGDGGTAGSVGFLMATGVSTLRTGTLSAAAVPAPAGKSAARPHPEMKQEDLGPQTIEGVLATGHRMTMTWPAGSQGNDRPFDVVNENWFSPDIKETVLSKNSDPRSGESTTKLINIDRAEPAAALFIPPADYQIVGENGPFQIHWTGPRQ